ncbi:rod shape-determining protein RodA [Thioalkalivibrio sp. XN8]|uniref:rod shape-determining protein RodA n=1 Tax=Thioalkalivibrio sp. XN8 TaxID=2712863 RepID=UPI0013ED712E|nr:rod shape-determining protein RodA [Thioalkalivibrio sp. XN8]NGP54148.1 rod shape-determining protein RodA [Thioalkalivibrio sp. XN8]
MAVSSSVFGERHSLGLGARLLAALKLDAPLLLGLAAIAAFGLVVLWSAGGQEPGLLVRQLVRLGVAFGVMLVVAQVPPKMLRLWSPWLFALGLALLVAVLLVGDVGKGAQRWLDLGVVRFQPSELMKLAVPMMAAWYLHDRPLPPRLGELALVVVVVAVPAVLIARQPDLGTALLVASAGILVVLLGGLRVRMILLLGAVAAVLAPVLWHFMHDYQRRRVLTFLQPESDPLGSGYHIIQSKIAIGSGGLFGKGWGNGSQAQLEFLPERSTDFIFAVLGEEFGLLGLGLLLVGYLVVVGRGLFIALQAQDTFSRLLAGSISLTFFVYVFVNTGMVTGLLPVVGVPLPLVSYGGTSMVTLMAGFGMLMSIHGHRNLLAR